MPSPTLGIQIAENGAKSFVLQNQLHRKTLRLKIDPAARWSNDEAQVEAM